MRPTPRPRLWNERRELAERLLGSKRPLPSLQELQELQARSLRELRAMQRLHIQWPHVGGSDFIFYTPNQIQHLIRLESAAGRASPAPGRAREPRPPPSALAPYESPGAAVRARGDWAGPAGGWLAGAVLLLAALLLVRYVDRCLARKLALRRRRSEEWPTPSVLATSHQYEAEARDPPPPYAECAAPPAPRALHDLHAGKPEEPPPPYSACYVAFSEPKHGSPSVSLLRERAESAGHSRLDLDKADGCDSVRSGGDTVPGEERREL